MTIVHTQNSAAKCVRQFNKYGFYEKEMKITDTEDINDV